MRKNRWQSIRNMLSSEAVVIRQGNHETVATTALVPGDIVVIRAGDRIPADLRVIEAHNLRVEEAILTGESTDVEKNTEALSGELPLGDRTNLLFSGTTVSSGRRERSGGGDRRGYRTGPYQPDDGGY